jgi:hypothetical protein
MTRLDRLTERLNLKEFQLRALLDLTKAINNNIPDAELLKLYAGIMHGELGITRLMLFEHDGLWRMAHAYGADGASRPDAGALIASCRDITFIGGDDAHGAGGFDIAVPVFHRERPLALLLIGDLDEEEQRMSPTVKHLNFIQTLTNLIAVAQENRRFAQRALAQERDRRELELAAEMQQMLVPRDLPTEGRVQAAGWYQPHQQVGGDYYDVIRTGPEQYVICVADVSGKGIPAALLMSNFQATLRAMLQHGPANLGPIGGGPQRQRDGTGPRRAVHHPLHRPCRPGGRGDELRERRPQPPHAAAQRRGGRTFRRLHRLGHAARPALHGDRQGEHPGCHPALLHRRPGGAGGPPRQ